MLSIFNLEYSEGSFVELLAMALLVHGIIGNSSINEQAAVAPSEDYKDVVAVSNMSCHIYMEYIKVNGSGMLLKI